MNFLPFYAGGVLSPGYNELQNAAGGNVYNK